MRSSARACRCGLLAASLLLSSLVSGFCQGEGSSAVLRQKLAAYASTEDHRIAAERHLAALESEDYAIRRQAMDFLIKATGFHDLVAEALEEAPSRESHTALRIILRAQAAAGAEEKLRLLMRRVIMEKVKGLAGEILEAWEGRRVTSGESNRLSRAALVTTLQPEDLALFKKALSSPTPLVRELAVLGIQQVATEEDLGPLLRPLLEDADEAVRLRAAILLAQQEERATLKTLASLLESDLFYVRNQSHDLLAAMTEQDFGYYSDAIPAERKKAARLWQRWVAKFGNRAHLRFEKVRYWIDDEDGLLE